MLMYLFEIMKNVMLMFLNWKCIEI